MDRCHRLGQKHLTPRELRCLTNQDNEAHDKGATAVSERGQGVWIHPPGTSIPTKTLTPCLLSQNYECVENGGSEAEGKNRRLLSA